MELSTGSLSAEEGLGFLKLLKKNLELLAELSKGCLFFVEGLDQSTISATKEGSIGTYGLVLQSQGAKQLANSEFLE